MEEEGSAYQHFMSGLKDILHRLDVLEKKISELKTYEDQERRYKDLDRRCKDLEEKVENIKQLKQLPVQIAQLRMQVVSLEAVAKGELSSAPPNITGKEEVSTADLFTLPDTLRRTYLALLEIGGEADLIFIAGKTGHTRGFENVNLNKLHALGYVEKVKKKRKVYFKAIPKAPNNMNQ